MKKIEKKLRKNFLMSKKSITFAQNKANGVKAVGRIELMKKIKFTQIEKVGVSHLCGFAYYADPKHNGSAKCQ